MRLHSNHNISGDGLRAMGTLGRGPKVVPVQSWFQAALLLATDRQVEPFHLEAIARDVMEGAGLGVTELANLVQDIVRRGHLPAKQALEIVCAQSWADVRLQEITHKRLLLLESSGECLPPQATDRPDYVALVKGWARRH